MPPELGGIFLVYNLPFIEIFLKIKQADKDIITFPF